MRATLLSPIVSIVALVVCSAGPVRAGQTAAADEGAFRFEWKDHPTFRISDAVRVELRLRVQADAWTRLDGGEVDVDRRPLRAGIAGSLFDRVDYEVSRDLDEGGRWRDVYVDVEALPHLGIRVGTFKMPFGRDRLLAGAELDFVVRSLLAERLAPGRNTGVMLHGRAFDRRIDYRAGVFRRDGEAVEARERSLAARLTTRPFRTRSHFENLEIGVAATASALPEGLSSVEGRSVFGDTFFPPVHVQGRRVRLGGDVEWRDGSFSLSGEVMRTREERRGQGIRNDNLPDLVAHAWYLGAAWVVTGEPKKSGGVEPRRPVSRGGPGAFELAARIEQLGFGSRDAVGPAFRGPRASHIRENHDRVLTTGITWYANRWIKAQANAVRERILDIERASAAGPAVLWSAVVRLQLAL